MNELPPTTVRLSLRHAPGGSGARRGEPVTLGVPFPRGACRDSGTLLLRGAGGAAQPLQARVLDRWSDGTARWVLLDFQATVNGEAGDVDLVVGGGDAARGPTPKGGGIRVAENDGVVSIETGAASFRVSAESPALVADARVGGERALAGGALRIVDAQGGVGRVRWRPPAVEEDGPLRACVRAEGDVRGRGWRLALVARLHFFAASPVVRLLLTIRNPRRAAHPGGYWELGDAGSVLLKEASLILRAPGGAPPAAIRCSLEAGEPLEAWARSVHVHQESSGGKMWDSPNHVNRDGRVALRFRGYRAALDAGRREGLRASPVVLIDRGGVALGAAFPRFWQNFPRAVEATPDQLALSFWPAAHGDLHELQGGEQKTHECFLAFGPDRVTGVPLEWCRSRLVATAAPECYAASGAVTYLSLPADDPRRGYASLVGAAIDGDDTLLGKRERLDEYGWRHFGEIYGDHEAVRQTGSEPLVSHYNNQYDPVAGFAYQFMRSGDARWWTQGDELAAHVVDIDLYHTDEDKAAYNQGLFWHTVHYIDAGKATHRSYPRAAGSHGGGPASEQNYTTGLALRYFMTGDAAAREAAVGLAQFVIDMDDGSKTVFGWLDHGYTGLATASGSTLYHGPGRGSGNSLNALVDGHHLTGDRRFLDKAEQVVRRCVHPRQDIDALELLDAERKWFYTMFLQALARYIDCKAELGEVDAMYAYGRAALLHYARWMAEHEYPYLDKPEILEFPTETWAAQDLRKSEVFDHAARHTSEAERDRFVERAEFFYDYAVSTLSRMPTRTLARPVVLLLSHGFMRAWSASHPSATLPAPQAVPATWGAPERFEPQKPRALRRAKALAVAAAATAAAAALVAWLVL